MAGRRRHRRRRLRRRSGRRAGAADRARRRRAGRRRARTSARSTGCLDRLGIDALPLVLLSHLDADHVGGLAGALGRPRRSAWSPPATLSPADDRVRRLDRLGAADAARAGRPRARVTAAPWAPRRSRCWPPTRAGRRRPPRRTTCRMVVRVTRHGASGCSSPATSAPRPRRGWCADGDDLPADVLKVPHHGSADADPDFLAASGARVALISVGADNTYGHPTAADAALARAGRHARPPDRPGRRPRGRRAGRAWGVAVRGRRASAPAAGTPADASGGPSDPPWHRWQRAGSTRGTHLAPPGGDGGGGAAAGPRGVRGAGRGASSATPTPRCTSWPPPACRSASSPTSSRPSLFGGHRLVVVTGVHEAAAALADSLTSYAKDPDPELTLVIVHFGGKRNEALVKAFTAAGAASTTARRSSPPGDRAAFVAQRGPHVRRPDHRATPSWPWSTPSAPTSGSSPRRPASWSPTSAAASTPTRWPGSTAARPR